MTKVWLVTDGDYSDYRVRAVASTEENAEKLKKLLNCDNTPEEFILDEYIEYIDQGLTSYRVWITKDGDATVIKLMDDNTNSIYWCSYSNKFRIDCWAKDEQHAAKIANEHRVQIMQEPGPWDV